MSRLIKLYTLYVQFTAYQLHFNKVAIIMIIVIKQPKYWGEWASWRELPKKKDETILLGSEKLSDQLDLRECLESALPQKALLGSGNEKREMGRKITEVEGQICYLGAKILLALKSLWVKMLKSYLLNTWLLDLASFSLGPWDLTLHHLPLSQLP